MGIAPLLTLLIAFFLVGNESSQVENIPSSEISPSFRIFLPGQVSTRTTIRTNLKPLTTKAKPKNQAIMQGTTKASSRITTTSKTRTTIRTNLKPLTTKAKPKNQAIMQWTTKASSRITPTTKRNGPTTKPIKNQQLQKTTPKRTQTTKAKGKQVTTTQKLAQMKKTTTLAAPPRMAVHSLFFNSPIMSRSPSDETNLLRMLPEPTLIRLQKSPSPTNVSSFDPTRDVAYGITFPPSTSNTTEDYEDYGNLTTTEEPELYEDLAASYNTTWTVSLPTMVPESSTVEEVTRKRLKRRKTTTIDPALTTRRRLKRRKTTTVGPE